MQRRPLVLAVTVPVLAAAVLSGVPGSAAPATWAATCADDAARYCIESAVITPAGGATVPLADAGLTASAATVTTDEWPATLSWSVDGWAGQPAEITGGVVTLVIRTGAYVPRVTTATAADVRATRTDNGPDDHRLTVTGTPAAVAWTSDADLAQHCASATSCGDFSSAADAAGTGVRFQGLSLDLDGYAPGEVAALDGTSVATDAQSRLRNFTYNAFGTDPFLMIGSIGNPQLDVDGDPVHNRVSVWLPPAYLAAVGATTASPFDVAAISGLGTAGLTSSATAQDGGVRLVVPAAGFGSTLGMVTIRAKASTAVAGQSAPAVPQEIRAMADVSGGARVSWLPPAAENGSPVTAYRARAYLNATAMVGSCTTATLSCTLTGLTAGQNFYVRVSAVSALGEGPSAVRAIDRPTAPSAPRTPVVTPGAGRLTLSWTAPASTGGQPVTGWTVRAYRAATGGSPFATCTAPADRLTCVVTGQTAGAKVYLSVLARNMVGSSPETARVAGTVWTTPGAPRSVAASSSRSRVTVTWAAPSATGGTAVTGYRVALYGAATGGSAAVRCTGTATARSCTTTALTPGRTYYATVAATNAAGTSAEPARVKVLVKR